MNIFGISIGLFNTIKIMLEISSDAEEAIDLITRHAQIYMEDMDLDEKITKFKVFGVIETLLLVISNGYVEWRIHDFPEGAPTSKVVVLTYYFANFLPKTA